MNTKLMRILLVSNLFLQACTNSTSPRMQCNQKCAEKTNTCYLTQAVVVNAQTQTSNAPPATQYSSSSPKVTSETEANNTFSTSSNRFNNLNASPTDSQILNASFSSSIDVDIFYYIPESYETQVYFKSKNSANCKVYKATTSDAHNSLLSNNTAVPTDGNEFQFELSTSPNILGVSTLSLWSYSFVCTGNSGDSYSIQLDPTPNSYAQYLQNQGLYTAPGTVSPLTAATTLQTCEGYKSSCYKGCKSKIF